MSMRNFKISHRMLAAALITVTLMGGAVYTVFRSSANTITSYENTLTKEVAISMKAHALEGHIAHTESLIEKLVRLSEPKLITEIKDEHEKVLAIFDELKKLCNKAEMQEVATLVKNYEDKYIEVQSLTENAINEMKIKGWTHKMGLQGDFRREAHFLMATSNKFVLDFPLSRLNAIESEKATKASLDLFTTSLQQYCEGIQAGIDKRQDKYLSLDKVPKNEIAAAENDIAFDQALLSEFKAHIKKINLASAQGGDVEEGRKLALSMAPRVAELNIPGILTLLLQVRRQEKDYQLRGDDDYVDKLKDDLSKVRERFKEAEGIVDKSLIEQINKQADSYEAKFLKLVDADAKLNTALDDLETTLSKIDAEKIIAAANGAQATKKAKIEENTKSNNHIAIAISIAAVIISLILNKLISSSISRPINALRTEAQRIGDFDLSSALDTSGKDELTDISTAFEAARCQLQQTMNNISSSSEQTGQAAQGLNTVSTTLEGSSENLKEKAGMINSESVEMSRNMEQVDGSIQNMRDTCDVLVGSMQNLNDCMNTVAAAVEESQVNLSSIADSGQDMNKVISEIAEGHERGRATSQQALEAVSNITKRVDNLSESSEAIVNVVSMIMDISEQTRNLALNAQIEAARAGEAGKGFAVVANEVKNLASETAKASESIRETMLNMKTSIEATVEDASAISNVINEVNDMINSLASAVEEQSITVRSNTENTSQAADGMLEVSRSVTQSVDEINSLLEGMQSLSGETETIASSSAETTGISERVKSASTEMLQETEKTITDVNRLSSQAEVMNQTATVQLDAVRRFTL